MKDFRSSRDIAAKVNLGMALKSRMITLIIPNSPLLLPFEEAIEIAATQTKSACADWVITGLANPDLVSYRAFPRFSAVLCFIANFKL
jgi:hypothetical protein